MTYSIVALGEDGAIGGAGQSGWPGLANATVGHGNGGLAVVQGSGSARLARTLVADGWPGPEELRAACPDGSDRQVLVVGHPGPLAMDGGRTWQHAGTASGPGCAAAGNLLASPDIPRAMVSAYDGADGDLERGLLAALRAAEDRGGDRRGAQSSWLSVRRGDDWQEWRIDHGSDPVRSLERAVLEARALAGIERAADAGSVLAIYDSPQVRFWLAVHLAERLTTSELTDLVEPLRRDPVWRALLQSNVHPDVASLRSRLTV